MAGGAQPKRVTCPTCGAGEGIPCVDRTRATPVPVAIHAARREAAEKWYRTPSPDGLTPERRDEMVEQLQDAGLRRGQVGKAMERITTAADSEAELRRILG